MQRNFYGDYEAFSVYFKELTNGSATEKLTYIAYIQTFRVEINRFMSFYAGVIKGVGFPLGLVLQLLTVMFLIRGNSGYSRSARNWFLLVVGADIGSTVYRVYEMVTQDFVYSNLDSTFSPGRELSLVMWGLRQPEHAHLQNVICKVFFIILYIPINLSPIALTVSSLIRGYCVKFPLRAKATFTKCIDRCLMCLAAFLALTISIVYGALVVEGKSLATGSEFTVFDIKMRFGNCAVPKYEVVGANQALMSAGYTFMLSVVFIICAANFVSAIVIIMVLFEARSIRKRMSATESKDSNSEHRATAMLLGMNVTLFICFFISRLLIVISTKIDFYANPVAYVVSDRLGYYLFTIPYYTNSVFIAAFSRRFYEFFLPCAVKPIVSASSQSRSTE